MSGIDCEEARNEEERLMLKDAREWVAAGEVREELHSKTRASALHVAAAKGYIKVMEWVYSGLMYCFFLSFILIVDFVTMNK